MFGCKRGVARACCCGMNIGLVFAWSVLYIHPLAASGRSYLPACPHLCCPSIRWRHRGGLACRLAHACVVYLSTGGIGESLPAGLPSPVSLARA
jgi:hypothetical protein